MINTLAKAACGRHTLSVAPTVEPVSVSDGSPMLHIKYTPDQETRVTNMLVAARQRCENWCGIAFTTQTWTLTYDVVGPSPLDNFWYEPCPMPMYSRRGISYLPPVIEIPRPPLLTVSSIQYYLDDDTDTATTFSSSYYYVSKPAPTVGTAPEPGRIMLRNGRTWPTGLRPIDSLVITYTCGYGATAASVPQPIKEGILMMAAHMYENREGQRAMNEGGAIGSNADRSFVPPGVQDKLIQFKVVRA